MLTFFRRIRQGLLASGATRKYILYAIGEILLVMIGILLALQVNNWNEWRKDRSSEQDLLLSLATSLQNDSINIAGNSASIEQGIESLDVLINNSSSTVLAKYTQTELVNLLLTLYRASRTWMPNDGIYNQITANDQIQLIQSKEIRQQLVQLYDIYFKRYAHQDQSIEQKHSFELDEVICNKMGLIIDFHNESLPTIDEHLFEKHYDELAGHCRALYRITTMKKETLRICNEGISELLQLLREAQK